MALTACKSSFRITVPLAISGLVSVFVYCFMVAWNDYLFASIFLSSASLTTLPVGLNTLFSTPDYLGPHDGGIAGDGTASGHYVCAV